MKKIAIIEVKIGLPLNFRPRTMTYRAFSRLEKDSEKEYVLERAKELFVGLVLDMSDTESLGLRNEDLKVKVSMTLHTVHCYIPTENEIYIKFEKDNGKA